MGPIGLGPDNAAPMQHALNPTPPNALLIATLLGQIAFGLLAMTICLPSMQEWGAIFDARPPAVQLSFSAYVVSFGVLQLVYGPLSDRHGRKPILLTGLAVAGAGSVLAAMAPNLEMLIAARIVQGAGSAAGMVVGRSMVQDLFQGPQRTRMMAYIGMVMGLCPPVATVIGGQLHVRLGWQSNFVLMAVMALLLLVTAWRLLPAHVASAKACDKHWLVAMASAYALLAREPVFLLYVAILSLTTGAFYVFLAGAPLVLGRYGVRPDGVGWYIMVVPVSYIVGNFLTSRLVRSQGEARMMALGQAAALGGLCLMLVLSQTGFDSPLGFVLPLALLGVGHGFLMPPSLAGSVGVLAGLAGAAAAVAGLMQQLTGAMASYAVGLLPNQGSAALGALMVGFTLFALAAQLALRRQRRGGVSAGTP
jgi:DHA1 family bicyclomycin/chloramphenicol resistance-like MFS transporter